MKIKECRTKKDIASTYSILKQMYDIPEAEFISRIKDMMEHGYRLIGAFEKGKCLGLSGFEIGSRLYCGKSLHVHNLAVDKKIRREKKIGTQIMEWLKKEAEKNSCETILADTYTENHGAQKFLMKQGFYIRGFHMKMDL